ncbi:MAG: STAS domain-containing protein [Tepidisphaeraceae bacterium]
MEFYFHETDNNVLVLAADGGLNAQTSHQFVEELERLIDGGITRMIVDCSHLEHISSYGIGVLFRLHKRLISHGADVRLAAVNSAIVKVLSVARLEKFFQIYPDVDRARLSFRERTDHK